MQKPELEGFVCEACVTVAGPGFKAFRKRKEQELYYFNRMAFRVYTELGSVSETSTILPKYCLVKGGGSDMKLQNDQVCPEVLAMGVVGSADPQDRLMKLVDPAGQCLEAGKDGTFPTLKRSSCDSQKPKQLISPMAIPSLLWSMHQVADRNAQQDLHLSYSSFCGAHGALSSLAFQQIFAGEGRRRSARPLSSCHFAPVIKFGTFVATGITRDKTTSNWPNWNTQMADNPIQCPDGEALTGFKLESASKKFMYECSRIGGLGAQYEYFTSQVEVPTFDANPNNWLKSIRMLKIDCGENALLSGFHFEFSEGGRWARSKFTCSKAGGAPVVMEPSTTVETQFHRSEGVFCPAFRSTDTGRYTYENSITGDTLVFQEDGRWCVRGDCSKKIGGENPIDATMDKLEVANVTDFDGEFEAKGVPDMSEGGAAGLAQKLKRLKPPKRPAQPPKPKLAEFKAEQPKYAEECLNYEDLWKKIIETQKGEDDEPVTEENTLEAEEGTEGQELLDYHPCAVAAGAGGVFGKLAGQSGKLAPENMLYSDWNECMQGDINRDLYMAHWDFAGFIHELTAEVVTEGINLVCEAPPDVEIAPLGAGVEVEPDEICESATQFAEALSSFPFEYMASWNAYAVEKEGFMACNPFQVGFSRLFCDIHCVRDAVVRGDRTIIRNMEKATKITNDNMKKMVEWSTEANRAETEYLDKKIDHSLKVNTLYLDTIMKQTEPQSLQDVAATTGSMLEELDGMAEASSFSEASRRSAIGGLTHFVEHAEQMQSTGNLSLQMDHAGKFQSQVSALYQTLKGSSNGMTKAQVVGKQIALEANRLQKQLRGQLHMLGIYRRQSEAAHKEAMSWNTSDVVVTLDHLWWRIRDQLDKHLDAAEQEVARYRSAFASLEDFQNCKSSFSDLLSSYAKSMSVMTKNHHKLHKLWREASNSIGELAAVIQDGDVFGKFMKEEGCKSAMALQTLKQTTIAVQGMGFLQHRFHVAGLKPPQLDTIKTAASQVKGAYKGALKICRK